MKKKINLLLLTNISLITITFLFGIISCMSNSSYDETITVHSPKMNQNIKPAIIKAVRNS